MAFGSDAIHASFPPADKPAAPELRLLGQPSEDRKQNARAGFGAGTLSPSGAALKTIKSTFDSAENLVPSLDELKAAIRDARLERETQREQQISASNASRSQIGFQQDVDTTPDPNGPAAVFTQSTGEEQLSPLSRIGSPGETGAGFDATSTPAAALLSPRGISGAAATTNLLNFLA